MERWFRASYLERLVENGRRKGGALNSDYVMHMAGKGYGMFDVATLLCSSVDPSLLLHDQREEEFLGVYFNELQSSLKEARKPPLPPGYKWEDCMSSYELCILDHCAELHLREDSGSEYACLRCGEVVERLEKTVDTNSNDLSASQWKSVIFNQFP